MFAYFKKQVHLVNPTFLMRMSICSPKYVWSPTPSPQTPPFVSEVLLKLKLKFRQERTDGVQQGKGVQWAVGNSETILMNSFKSFLGIT